jgi:ribonuclease HI
VSESERGWTRVRFRTNKVWLATEADGRPKSKNGKVLIKYQLDQPHEYWVHEKSILPLEAAAADNAPQAGDHPQTARIGPCRTRSENGSAEDPAGGDVICMYTDGASSGNPGPSGVGIVIQYRDHQRELSRYIGETTNNVAELIAIQTGLSALKTTEIPVRIFTDSNYAYGILALGWKPRRNRELVDTLKQAISAFRDLKVIKVSGHSGVAQNERADFLANAAIQDARRRGAG